MSAIWGEIRFDGNTAFLPDDTGKSQMQQHYEENCILDCFKEEHDSSGLLFGCGVRYITKRSHREILPLRSDDGRYFFTADAILDNHSELAEELQITNGELPDGALMFRAFLQWGTDSFVRFHGLFSLAIYDTESKELILAADKTSSRCLYYYRYVGGICFSTLIQPIRLLHPEITINELYLKDYLLAPGLMPNIVPDETAFTGVFKLQPGSFFKFSAENVTQTQYWTPEMFRPNYHCYGAKSYGRKFLELYRKSVEAAMSDEGETGIAMSSGLDSASVGALAATKLAKEKKTLYTYTYIPASDQTYEKRRHFVYNEQSDVETIGKMYPNMKQSFLCNEGKDCVQDIGFFVSLLEMPYKAFTNMPNLMELYQKARQDGCRIVFNGQYGNSTVSHGVFDDVIFDLYNRYDYIRFITWSMRFCKKEKIARKKALVALFRNSYKSKKSTFDGNYPETVNNTFVIDAILQQYPLQDRYHHGKVPTCYREVINAKEYHQYLYLKPCLVYLGELETKLGLKTGVIIRDPTRDEALLQFCRWLPYRYFAYRGIPRWLIRGNMQAYFPSSILNNYNRYGLQNADWINRVIQNRDRFRLELQYFTQEQKSLRYINTSIYNEYIVKIKYTPADINHVSLIDFLIVYTLDRFLQQL